MTDHDFIERAIWSAECQVSDVVAAAERDPDLRRVAQEQLEHLSFVVTSAALGLMPTAGQRVMAEEDAA